MYTYRHSSLHTHSHLAAQSQSGDGGIAAVYVGLGLNPRLVIVIWGICYEGVVENYSKGWGNRHCVDDEMKKFEFAFRITQGLAL